MGSNIEMKHSAPIMGQSDKDKQNSKTDSRTTKKSVATSLPHPNRSFLLCHNRNFSLCCDTYISAVQRAQNRRIIQLVVHPAEEEKCVGRGR